MRIFVAVEPDDAARAALAKLTSALRERSPEAARAWRWVPPENVHITLHFLGEISEERTGALISGLGPELDLPAFDVDVDQLGQVPPAGRPRVLWAAVGAGRDALESLQQATGARLAAQGFPSDDRPFVPHLTLARFRDGSRRGRGQLPVLEPFAPVRWPVRAVTVLRSHLSDGPARYETIHRTRLLMP